jgi:aryl-alcohol dehydrogenase-like predicted oxidoreductase
VTDIAYRRLGRSGLVVSTVGIGCNNFGRRIGDDAATEVVQTALDLGINLFDTADVYGDQSHNSEEVLGAALGKRRDEAVIATKFGLDLDGHLGVDHGARGSRRYIMRAVESSLRRLGTEYIDLYQYHAPDSAGTPIEETLSALDELVRSGKVRYVGHSNFAAWQVADADWIARDRGLTPFVSAQNHYSLLSRDAEKELIPALSHFGLGLLPYFPLESGLLTGKYTRGEAAPTGSRMAGPRFADRLAGAPWETIEALTTFSREHGLSILDVAIGGLAARPAVTTVIAGATSGDQVRANAAAGAWRPTADDLAALDAILEG